MRTIVFFKCVLTILFLFNISCIRADFTAKVQHVVDGDTIYVVDKFGIKLSRYHIASVVRDNNITLKQTRPRHEPITRYKKPIDINNIGNLCKFTTVVISTHPHRWPKYALTFLYRKYFFAYPCVFLRQMPLRVSGF